MNQDQFIQALLKAAQDAGMEAAEAYCLHNESMKLLMGPGTVEQYAVNTTGGVSLRGLYKGKMGAAFSEAMDEEAIRMLVENAMESARLIEDKDEQFLFSGSESYQTVTATGDLGTAEARIDFALEMEKTGRELDPRVKELGAFTMFTSTHATERLCNTYGLDLSHTQDQCAAIIEAIAREGERVATAFAVETGHSLSDLDAKKIATEAVEEAVSRLHASPCKSGEMAIIFRNDAMADLLGAFSGIYSADAAQKGLSLLAGKEGEMIAAPCVSLVDDPLMKDGVASSGFDGEGVATYTKRIIDAGKLTTLLHNLKTAHKAGTTSTGNASRGGISGSVGVSASNLYIAPGDLDLEGLEADMQNGLVITSLEGLHAGVDSISGDFSLSCMGYLVEQGKRTQAVEQVTVAGNFFACLRDVLKVGNDLRFYGSSVGSPSVRIKSLSIAGK